MRYLIALALLVASPVWAQSPVPLSSLPALGILPPSANILVSVTGPDGRPTFARVAPAATQAGLVQSSQLGSNIGQIPGPLVNFNGTGIPGYQVNLGLIIARPTTHGNDVFDFQSSRDANYTGGTFGFLNSAARFTTYARAGTASFELASISILNNYALAADNSQNTAHASQTNVYGTGGSWAGVSELNDYGSADPTKPRISHEFDNRANGTDAYKVRIGLGMVIGKRDIGGAAAQVSWGYRIENSSEGASGSWYEVGYGTGNAVDYVPVKYVFDASRAVAPTGYGNPVTALRMASGQVIDFKGDGTRTLAYNPAGALQYNISGSTVAQINDSGVAFVAAVQLTADAKAVVQFDGASNKFVIIYNGVRLMSLDQSGNMTIKGTLTQSGTP